MRALAAGCIAGLLAGVAAGIVARVAMRLVALGYADSSMQVPEFTIPGTVAILISGAVAGAPFGPVFGLVSPMLRGPSWWRGLLFGTLLLVAAGPLFFTGIEEFFNEGRVLVFLGVFPVYGVALGILTEPSRRIAAALSGSFVALAVLFAALGTVLIGAGGLSLATRSTEIYGPLSVSLFVASALGVGLLLARRRPRFTA